MNEVFKKSWFRSAVLATLILGSLGLTYFLFTPRTTIYDFDEQRDTAFIVDIFNHNWYWLVSESSVDFSPEYVLRNRASLKDKGTVTVKVLYTGRTPIGFIAYYKKKFYEGSIYLFGVRDEFRSKGYGYKLLDYAVKDLISQGCTLITLVTRTNNYAAQATYKKRGFTESSRTDGFVTYELRVS